MPHYGRRGYVDDDPPDPYAPGSFSPAERRRIVSILNLRHRMTLTVDLLQTAVVSGLTTWERLADEAAEAHWLAGDVCGSTAV